MNNIKNFFKKMWRGIRNFFSIDSVKTVDTETAENIPCTCTPECSCDKDNCTCNPECNCEKDNHNCVVDNKTIEEQYKDYEQLTLFDEIDENPEMDNCTQENNQVRYTDDTVTRDILIAVLRENGVTGISRLKKTELLVKFHELGLEFPEIK